MLIKGNDVIGIKILAIENGAYIGKVHDLIYDPRVQNVRALLIDAGGWFSDAKVILFEDVKHFGEDAIMVDSEKVVKKASEVSQRIAHIAEDDTYLTKTKIVTEAGKELGGVTDIHFDPTSGKVEEFEVKEGLLESIQSGSKVVKVADLVTVGEDATIVKSYTEQQFEEQSREQGLKGAYVSGKEKAQEYTKQAQQKAEEYSDKAKSTYNESKEKLGESSDDPKVHSNLIRARLEAEAASDRANKKLQNVTEKARKQFLDTKNSPKTQEKVDKVKETFNKASHTVSSKIDDMEQKMHDEKREGATGKYVTKTILLPDDKVLAERGEMVTYNMLDKAEHSGIAEEIYGNLSQQPIH